MLDVSVNIERGGGYLAKIWDTQFQPLLLLRPAVLGMLLRVSASHVQMIMMIAPFHPLILHPLCLCSVYTHM